MSNKKNTKKKVVDTEASENTTPKTMITSTRKSYIGFITPIALLVLSIALVIAMVVIFTRDVEKIEPNSKNNAESTQTSDPEVVYRGKGSPKGTVDANRKKLTQMTTKLLQDSTKMGKTSGGYEAVMQALDSGDESVIPKSLADQFRWADHFEDDSQLRRTSYMSVIYIAKTIEEALPAGQSLEVLVPGAEQFVYVDMEAGQAFVPLTLYLGSKAPFSFEFVWANGKWSFVPYSLVDQINAANIASGLPGTENKE